MDVRRATDGDLEAIVALQRDANGAETEWMVRALFGLSPMEAGGFTVACDGGRSSMEVWSRVARDERAMAEAPQHSGGNAKRPLTSPNGGGGGI